MGSMLDPVVKFREALRSFQLGVNAFPQQQTHHDQELSPESLEVQARFQALRPCLESARKLLMETEALLRTKTEAMEEEEFPMVAVDDGVPAWPEEDIESDEEEKVIREESAGAASRPAKRKIGEEVDEEGAGPSSKQVHSLPKEPVDDDEGLDDSVETERQSIAGNPHPSPFPVVSDPSSCQLACGTSTLLTGWKANLAQAQLVASERKWIPQKGSITHIISQASKFLMMDKNPLVRLLGYVPPEASKSKSLPVRVAGFDWTLEVSREELRSCSLNGEEALTKTVVSVNLSGTAPWSSPPHVFCPSSFVSVSFSLISRDLNLPKITIESSYNDSELTICDLATAEKYRNIATDELEIRANFTVSKVRVYGQSDNWMQLHPSGPRGVVRDTLKLLESGENADLLFISKEGPEIRAHGFIFSMRNVYDILGCSEETLRLGFSHLSANTIQWILKFIYFDGWEKKDLYNAVKEVLPAFTELLGLAEKFRSPTLQKVADHIQSFCRDGNLPGKIPFEYIGSLMHSEKGADLILRLRDGEELKAHRFVLAMRSKFFRAKFASSMEETLEFPEINLKELRIFREFLYMGDLWRLNIEWEETVCAHWTREDEHYQNLFDLFDAAEKYEIADLKKILVLNWSANVLRRMRLSSNPTWTSILVLTLTRDGSKDLLMNVLLEFERCSSCLVIQKRI